MGLKYALDRIIEKYGVPVTTHGSGGRFETHAFIQPLRYKNKMYIDLDMDRMGKVDEGCYLYIGKADVPLEFKSQQTEITSPLGNFVVARSEKVCIGTDALYIWAILNPLIRE
ncbi:MAG TPA: hypothetical protein GXX17_01330 [Clostridiales bacterium]|nr:hypothetical protein [Clostridiales bacterium]